MVQFADDTSLVFSLQRTCNPSPVLFDTLNTLENWFSANNLVLNVNKTQLMQFSYTNSHERRLFADGDLEIPAADSALFLGVHLDSRLDWRVHVDNLAGMLAKYSYALKVLALNISEQASLIAYHAYVHSRIRYGIIFWGNSCEVSRILVLQKRCLRSVFNLGGRDSCRRLFRSTRILTVPSAYIFEAAVFIKTNPDLFIEQSRAHLHDTRGKSDLICRKPNFTYIQKNTHCSIIKIFNKLPINLRQLPLAKFKANLKNLLAQKVCYAVEEYLTDSLT